MLLNTSKALSSAASDSFKCSERVINPGMIMLIELRRRKRNALLAAELLKKHDAENDPVVWTAT